MTHYEHNPGIHFEKLGELRLFNNKWKLVTFVKLNGLNTKFLSVKNYYKVTAELCEHENAKYHFYICESFLKSSNYTLSRIGKELEVLNQLVGHDFVNRQKRGWFNIVGKATKILFGVLDEDDANYYNSKINEFSEENQSEINLLKEQTKIVQSALIHFNNTIGTLDFNENILKSNINKLRAELNKDKEDIQFLSLKVNLEDHITITNMILNQMQLEVMTLTNAILVAKKGILHPAIITPVQLISELKQVVDSLPHGVDFPAPLDPLNANLLLNIVELQVYFQNNNLIYIINIPLVESFLFYLYKVSPFPKLINQNQFILIKPSEQYIAIDENKQQFISLSEFEYNNCIKITENKIICKQQKPVSLAHLSANCEISLLQGVNKIPNFCDKRIIYSDRTIFIQLHTTNTWLFTVPGQETLTISCTNSEKPVDILLKTCGSVTIGKQCKAYSASAMLVPHGNILQSRVYSEFVPAIEISDDCCEKVKESKINFSEILLNEQYRTLSKHIPELNIASHKLSDIEQLADNISKKHSEFSFHYSGSVLAYILVFLVLIFIIYKVYRKCVSKTSCCGMLPNLCIRVNQNIEPASSRNQYVARYHNRSPEPPEHDHYPEDTSRTSETSRGMIGYIPARRTVK